MHVPGRHGNVQIIGFRVGDACAGMCNLGVGSLVVQFRCRILELTPVREMGSFQGADVNAILTMCLFCLFCLAG